MKTKKWSEWEHSTKQIFYVVLAFAIIGILNLIPFAVLSSMKLVATNKFSYFVVVAFLVVIWLPLFFKILTKTRFDLWVVVVFEIYITLAFLVGSLWSVYKLVFWYDKVVHVLFGTMAAFFAYYLFFKSSKREFPIVLMAFFVLAFAMLCGSVWEIFEFASDGIVGIDLQVTQGLVGRQAVENTMFDLICDFGGALLSCIFVVVTENLNKKKMPENNFEEKIENNAKNAENDAKNKK